MNSGKVAVVALAFATTALLAAEPADEFSRAECFNNESITYNYWDPVEWRSVYSWHFLNGERQHYVTENPPAWETCVPGFSGFTQVNGWYCFHFVTSQTRHAGVHGAFLSSEPNPDGTMIPGFEYGWTVQGIHTTVIPGVIYWIVHTTASDCNLHFEQFY